MKIPFFSKLDYFDSLDSLPIFNWLKIQETNDLGYLLKIKKECSRKEINKLEQHLSKLTDSYIDTFGVSDEYRKVLDLQREIRVKEIEFFITEKKINKTFINVLKLKLQAAMKSTNKTDIYVVSTHVSKWMGYRVDLQKTSVNEFYGILKSIKKNER